MPPDFNADTDKSNVERIHTRVESSSDDLRHTRVESSSDDLRSHSVQHSDPLSVEKKTWYHNDADAGIGTPASSDRLTCPISYLSSFEFTMTS